MKKLSASEQWFAAKLERRRKFQSFLKEAGIFILMLLAGFVALLIILGIGGGLHHLIWESKHQEMRIDVKGLQHRVDAIASQLHQKEDKKISWPTIDGKAWLTNTIVTNSNIYWFLPNK